MAERIQELEEAAVEYRQAREWAEKSRANAKRLDAELTAARGRLDEANNKVHLTHETLLEASLKL